MLPAFFSAHRAKAYRTGRRVARAEDSGLDRRRVLWICLANPVFYFTPLLVGLCGSKLSPELPALLVSLTPALYLAIAFSHSLLKLSSL